MSEPIIELIQYTDPYCTWCWGSEPMLRKIEMVFGDQVKLKYVVGGLVRDIRQFSDAGNNIGGKDWYKSVAAHWLEASGRHGMPVDEAIFFDIKDEIFSTYPASIAFKAAQLQDEKLANKYLRRLREAASAERLAIQHTDVQARLAEEVGLDSKQLLADIDRSGAKQAFEADLQECRRAGISGFPSFIVKHAATGKEYKFGNFRSFQDFREIFLRVGKPALVEKPVVADDAAIQAFITKYGKVALQELTEVFNLKTDECSKRVDNLASRGLVKLTVAGNGYFVTPS